MKQCTLPHGYINIRHWRVREKRVEGEGKRLERKGLEGKGEKGRGRGKETGVRCRIEGRKGIRGVPRLKRDDERCRRGGGRPLQPKFSATGRKSCNQLWERPLRLPAKVPVISRSPTPGTRATITAFVSPAWPALRAKVVGKNVSAIIRNGVRGLSPDACQCAVKKKKKIFFPFLFPLFQKQT